MIRERLKFFWTKNPLDLLNYEKLREEKIKLEYQVVNLHTEISSIEIEIDNYWNKAKETKSPADERALAERINTLSQRKNIKLQNISKIETNLRNVDEFINKLEEKKRISSLHPLTKGSQADLEDLLNKIKVYEEGVRQANIILSDGAEPKSDEIDDNVNDILQAIKATKEKETYKIQVPEKQTFKEQKDLE